MTSRPELIVMLTHNDMTVSNAATLFEACRDTKVRYWGLKEQPLPLSEMQALFSYMKQCGKKTCLEVVAYDEAAGIAGARTAVSCGCDVLMGTYYFDSVREICKENGMRYFPFVGTVHSRPSVLTGETDAILSQARDVIARGADGIDLLGYRYNGDADALIRCLTFGLDAPVCVAGSINSHVRLDAVLSAKPWGFTIGSAFFDGRFGGDIREQIEKLCSYMEQSDRTGEII